ncbi:hypothetical protein [Brucella intermedia]|uniref:hypothetical protein n=1 Tax=Brucella intermedia TaxID=94625 RepID=UPI00178C5381|nr:hypothetical protein [Brucella intermedia]
MRQKQNRRIFGTRLTDEKLVIANPGEAMSDSATLHTGISLIERRLNRIPAAKVPGFRKRPFEVLIAQCDSARPVQHVVVVTCSQPDGTISRRAHSAILSSDLTPWNES